MPLSLPTANAWWAAHLKLNSRQFHHPTSSANNSFKVALTHPEWVDKELTNEIIGEEQKQQRDE